MLFKHYETRIQGYVVDVRQCLKRCFPIVVSRSESQATEFPLFSHLYDLRDAAFAEYTSTTIRNETLVLQAHLVYKSFSVKDFDTISISGSQNLRSALGFLSRLKTSFSVLIRAAERLPGFEEINITTLMLPTHKNPTAKRGKADDGRWTLAQAFEYLGHNLTDEHVHILLGSPGKKACWTKQKLLQEFNRLGSSTWEVHAEMQLLPTYIQAVGMNQQVVRYIGCSKSSCFLCWHFLDLYASIQTRGCHGKLYHLWGLPYLENLASAQIEQVVASVRGVEDLVKRQILDQNSRVLRQVKELTVGTSSIRTTIPASEKPSMTKTVLEYLAKQRASLLFSSDNTK